MIRVYSQLSGSMPSVLGGVVGIVDVEVEQVQLLDEDGVDGPGVAVLDGDAVQADILTVHHGHGAGDATRSA